MPKIDTSAYTTYENIAERLSELVSEAKKKDTSLERSLDIYDEAIALGTKAVDLVDTLDDTSAADTHQKA